MHDTALRIGCLAMDIYADVEAARILELGSANVNGSLREHAKSSTDYVGVDIEAGNGVDIVVGLGEPLPVDDGSFDLVMASSVFEHDPAFWMTFLEMCRKTKPGGHIYINAPSNGAVHRFPEDHWRFYPDSATALVRWARSQNEQVTLVESFIAGREADIWNDFVAVFRKNGGDCETIKLFLHEQVPCSNVRTWESTEMLRQQDLPEDLVLLNNANRRHEHAEAEVAQLAARLAEAEGEVAQRTARVAEMDEALVAANASLDKRYDEIVELTAMVLERGHSAESQRQLDERFREIAALSGMLREREQSAKIAEDNAGWLRDVHLVLLACPRWWGLIPIRLQERKRDARLKRKGLFDGRAYLERYPDVKREGLNPFQHYMQHGQAEGRQR